jgi:hypothetical protein
LSNFAKTINDTSNALAKTNKGTVSYQQALDKVTNMAKKVFGDNITQDFVENNLETF